MTPVSERRAKDQKARFVFGTFLAGYGLFAVLTSVPAETLYHPRTASLSLPLVAPAHPRLDTKDRIWWREHRKMVRVPEKGKPSIGPVASHETPERRKVATTGWRRSWENVAGRQTERGEVLLAKLSVSGDFEEEIPAQNLLIRASLVQPAFIQPAVLPDPSYGDLAELLPVVTTRPDWMAALRDRGGTSGGNQCRSGKIAGWSGTRLLEKHKKRLKRAGKPDPQLISKALAARLTRGGFRAGAPVFMRIFKDRSLLQVWLKKQGKFALFHTYEICRWSGSFGPKLYEGDKQSPEGFYLVNRQLFNRPSWRWKGSFSIGYPNAYDRLHGRTGSLILVHGGCTSSGCFAMTDPVIREVRELAQMARQAGQDSFRINVYPFELTRANLEKHKNSPWIDFWKNLKTGYDLFEKDRLPPRVRVCNRRYVFARGDGQPAGSNWSGKGCYGLMAFVPGWKQAQRVAAKKSRAAGRVRRVGVRCNRRRASCRKWLALRRKRATIRRANIRKANIRKARAIGRRTAVKRTYKRKKSRRHKKKVRRGKKR